ncbi:hypothetical protein CAPTEDRAFT_187073 [Capitella teleta]|uniref:Uncharacterized protein n=1 Tax=Capitella teleta TaxID=283909 RepID=R7UH30_CAPTE|nr:hypothetical protein CAPTEDRAFT_187073 [Capitella teleta]|eukprot:ELU05849.1 hypothetical protein CAPTEDRAFT_187073 [Capitella teleta]
MVRQCQSDDGQCVPDNGGGGGSNFTRFHLGRELLYHCTTLKKRRGAYEKGQHQMILDDIIPESEVPDREKAWIDPKSAAAVKVEELVFNNHQLKDLATLSPHFQTYI